MRAYEAGEGSQTEVAERFSLNPWTLLRWIVRRRGTGTVAPLARSGVRTSPLDSDVLHAVVGGNARYHGGGTDAGVQQARSTRAAGASVHAFCLRSIEAGMS